MSSSRARKYRRLLKRMRTVNSYNSRVLSDINSIENIMANVLTTDNVIFCQNYLAELSSSLTQNKNMIVSNSIIPDIIEDIENEEEDDD